MGKRFCRQTEAEFVRGHGVRRLRGFFHEPLGHDVAVVPAAVAEQAIANPGERPRWQPQTV